jgi:hypothetical protein
MKIDNGSAINRKHSGRINEMINRGAKSSYLNTILLVALSLVLLRNDT